MFSSSSFRMNPNDNGTGDRLPNGQQANGSAIPWAEVFHRHETVLTSHLEMLEAVKKEVSLEGDEALRTVSSMVSKTVQAMTQFKVVRKKVLNMHNKKLSEPANPTENPKSSSTSQSTHTESGKRKRRSLTEKEKENTPTDRHINPPNDATAEGPVPKQRRNNHRTSRGHSALNAAEELPHDASPASDTEDISAEVQRRLRIKEELRRKKDLAQPEKRKRESLLSNESVSPGGHGHQKKRVRLDKGTKRGGGLISGQEDRWIPKRQKR